MPSFQNPTGTRLGMPIALAPIPRNLARGYPGRSPRDVADARRLFACYREQRCRKQRDRCRADDDRHAGKRGISQLVPQSLNFNFPIAHGQPL